MKVHEPPMTFKDDAAKKMWEEGLAKNREDAYGYGCFRYASEWATRVEQRAKSGKAINAEVLEKAAQDADTEGITGFMYGVAVNILTNVWIHGVTLAKWHNRQYMEEKEADAAAEEGKTVNPSIIHIQRK